MKAPEELLPKPEYRPADHRVQARFEAWRRNALVELNMTSLERGAHKRGARSEWTRA
jgi:hypothetical protein